MNTTIKTFSPSTNIVRDLDKSMTYIPTPNANGVFNQITNDYILGTRAFTIIGAYGTGKSSFLWAFEKAINGKKEYFAVNDYFKRKTGFDTVNIIGDYASIIDTFAKEFNVGEDFTTSELVQTVDKAYKRSEANNKGLILFIDEFGKFLEYAAKHNPEQELYFIQQIAEYVNDVEKDIILLTTLHQDFSSYAFSLPKNQRNEWTKVKGRLRDITFNEPVEQLLYLASERLANTKKNKKDKNFKKLLNIIKSSKSFPLRDYLNEDIAQKLLPFDILAASILTLALQKYGQNERSLFSFIESRDSKGINDFDKTESPYYNISSVYDYLVRNFPILSTRFNPHSSQWSAMRIAIERVEGIAESDLLDALKLVKTIGLLNIFAKESAQIDDDFLAQYGQFSLGIDKPKQLIAKLEKHKIIRFVLFSNKFILFEGTDLDIELEIDRAGNLIERVNNAVDYLRLHFDFPHILAKAAYFKIGTPRFFEFKISEIPISEKPQGEIDGFVNLIFSEDLTSSDIKKASKKCKDAVLYGWYRNTQTIRNLIFEIQKIRKVKNDNSDDKVAIRELDNILAHQRKLLYYYVMDSIYSAKSSIEWYYKGEKQIFKSEKSFNRQLSDIVYDVYSDTPIFRNEMVNKTRLSSPISTARKSLIRAFVNHWEKEGLELPKDKFPPEKTIYLSLIKAAGFVQEKEDGIKYLSAPTNQDFQPLWDQSEKFLNSAKKSRRNVREFIELLSHKPVKLKKGFVDFWLPIFLFIKKEDYALFDEAGMYISNISDQTLEIVTKNPHKYYIKAFDIDGINLSLFKKYRTLLGQKEEIPSSQSFIETIKPFLVFYHQLPNYSKKTKRLSNNAKAFREAIAKAKSPEKTFFKDFPDALGYSISSLAEDTEKLDIYIDTLYNSLQEIRKAFGDLEDRFEAYIGTIIGLENAEFTVVKRNLTKRFKYLRLPLLQPRQKVFLKRINSPLDRNDWLKSVCQACVGKKLDNISDSDEPILFDRFSELIHDLDNLLEISKVAKDNNEDDFVAVEIVTPLKGKNRRVVKLSKKKKTALSAKKKEIKTILGEDKDVNIGALTQLLNEILKNEQD